MAQGGTQQKRTAAGNGRRPITVEEWRKLTTHMVELPSGVNVLIRYPNLPDCIKSGSIPEDLKQTALRVVVQETYDQPMFPGMKEDGTLPTIDSTQLSEVDEVSRRLAHACLVDPSLTWDEFVEAALPPDDVDYLTAIAFRKVGRDAGGRFLGVEPLDRWEPFRREHDCPEDCPRCEAARSELSTTGAVFM
jgi:hypothetical protein